MEVKLRKVGGSLVMAIPASVRRELKLEEGSVLKVSSVAGTVTATPTNKQHRVGLEARLAMCDLSKPNAGKRSAEDRAWDEAPPVGREEI